MTHPRNGPPSLNGLKTKLEAQARKIKELEDLINAYGGSIDNLQQRIHLLEGRRDIRGPYIPTSPGPAIPTPGTPWPITCGVNDHGITKNTVVAINGPQIVPAVDRDRPLPETPPRRVETDGGTWLHAKTTKGIRKAPLNVISAGRVTAWPWC